MLNGMETFLTYLVEAGVRGFEIVGAVIIIVAGIRGIINYVQRKSNTQISLLQGLSTGLSFFLGSEVLHTIIARTFQELLLVACVIGLRVALTILMHWEMRLEHGHEDKPSEKQPEDSSEK